MSPVVVMTKRFWKPCRCTSGGSSLVGVVVLTAILSTIAIAFLEVTATTSISEIEFGRDQEALLSAESGIIMAASKLQIEPNYPLFFAPITTVNAFNGGFIGPNNDSLYVYFLQENPSPGIMDTFLISEAYERGKTNWRKKITTEVRGKTITKWRIESK